VLKGLARGRQDFGIHSGLIICAMRNMNVSLEMAELAVDFRERAWWLRSGRRGRRLSSQKHVDAFHYIQRENFNITIHAGEASARNRSGKRFNTAARIASGTGRALSTTSRSPMGGRSTGRSGTIRS